MTRVATYRPGRVNVFDEMDRMMESMIGSGSSAKASRYPAVDAVEKEGSFELSIELPGYGKDDVEIKVDNNLLTVSAAELKDAKDEKKEEKKESVRYIMHERSGRSFTRTFVLPKDVDKENIEASFENGLLTLNIPKVPKAEPKKIDIKVK
ncbi:MAG: Hsp20/alpha crystallin family protein [Spirochaetales bacterium]|uniref:Hsp20/alpha crystallin family protein n=1 Tax=Candidatus Thalassospirochaeta sargassi TaxID=3119039 RepID=A0AAJ1IFB0_9SPIO|nr:Hsp20/alpha crystallin family protein [Spirochaetales bacterium]